MNDTSSLSAISAVLEKGNVPHILIGGFAVNAYEVSRFTGDVDFLIDEVDYPKAVEVLKEIGYKEEVNGRAFARFSHPSPNYMPLDFLFVDQKTFREMKAQGKQVKMSGQGFVAPSLSHLIALKLHAIKNNPQSRELKDLSDIVDLIKQNRFDYLNDSFRQLCLKYGNLKIHQKIIEALGEKESK